MGVSPKTFPQPVAAIDTSLYHCQARAGAQRALIAHPVSLDAGCRSGSGVAQPVTVVELVTISAERADSGPAGRVPSGISISFAVLVLLLVSAAKYAILSAVGRWKFTTRTQVPTQNLAGRRCCRNSVPLRQYLALIQRWL